MKKTGYDFVADEIFIYEYVGGGSGDWNYYLKDFKLHQKYEIRFIEEILSELPLINECEIHLNPNGDMFDLLVIWKGNIMWSGWFRLNYCKGTFSLYDTEFAKYLEDRINNMK